MKNRYPGTCTDCGTKVSAGGGVAVKLAGRWTVNHGGSCTGQAAPERSYKAIHGRCEDAPCCGCCGGDQKDYYTGEDDYMLGYGSYSNDY